MTCRTLLIVCGSLMITPLTAQAPMGWMVRADNSTSASDPDAPGQITFVSSGSGLQATAPQAAVFWRPRDGMTGSYLLKGTFTLLEPSNHTNYYGLVFGGSHLDGPAQQYVYFLVAQDGTWLVKRRDGDGTTQTILPKTASNAIRKPDANGRSVNTLEVHVSPAAIDFVVNGTVVNRWLGASRAVKANGTYGMRVNHFLKVRIDGFAAMRRASSTRPWDAQFTDVETIALTSTVADVVSPTTFALKQGAGMSRADTLVAAPPLQRAVDLHQLVTVFGSPAALDEWPPKQSAVRLPNGVPGKYFGRPGILAATVLDTQMTDLTKPLPPPITADEERLDGLMKRIAPIFSGLRQAMDASNVRVAKDDARILADAFAEVEALWSRKRVDDAIEWARTARLQAEFLAHDAAGGRTESTTGAMATLSQQCQACHTMYREQFANGAFRIKKGR